MYYNDITTIIAKSTNIIMPELKQGTVSSEYVSLMTFITI